MAEIPKRTFNRSLKDVFQGSILPRQMVVLTDGVQKMSTYAKRVHTWKNRTGALQTSIGHEPAKEQGNLVVAGVFAGGPSRARFAFDVTARREEKLRRRNRRQGRTVRRGESIFVDYAKFVENKGFPVLKHAVKYILPRLRERLKQPVQMDRVLSGVIR